MVKHFSIFLFLFYFFTSVNAASNLKKIRRFIKVDNLTRSYTAYIPKRRRLAPKKHVIVALHPAASKGSWMEETTNLHTRGDDFIVVYPDSYYLTWNDGNCCGRPFKEKIDDEKFLKEVLTDLKKVANFYSKVFFTGFSGGARMSYELLCRSPEMLAGIATFGAVKKLKDCKKGHKIPLLHVHGLSDRASLPGGGVIEPDGTKYPSVRKTVTKVAHMNGCKGVTKVFNQDLSSICTTYKSCSQGAKVINCYVPRMGHTWPGDSDGISLFAPFRQDLDGSNAVLEFFKSVKESK